MGSGIRLSAYNEVQLCDCCRSYLDMFWPSAVLRRGGDRCEHPARWKLSGERQPQVYTGGVGLRERPCSSNLSLAESLKSGRGTTIRPTSHGLSATETSGIRTTTWELATVFPTRDSMAVATLTVLEPLPVMAARPQSHISLVT